MQESTTISGNRMKSLIKAVLPDATLQWIRDQRDPRRRQFGRSLRPGHLKPGKMSGGEQQRVVIARAIALRPTVLLADEPTGNLDPDTAGEVFDLLADINRAGTSMLVATHDYRHAERLGKRVIRIEEGRIVSDGGLQPCTT